MRLEVLLPRGWLSKTRPSTLLPVEGCHSHDINTPWKTTTKQTIPRQKSHSLSNLASFRQFNMDSESSPSTSAYWTQRLPSWVKSWRMLLCPTKRLCLMIGHTAFRSAISRDWQITGKAASTGANKRQPSTASYPSIPPSLISTAPTLSRYTSSTSQAVARMLFLFCFVMDGLVASLKWPGLPSVYQYHSSAQTDLVSQVTYS
ncbi:hypothetical protein QBC40DRAFT_45685 [Triangularia verruculosa]|uniref:Uncharacterized protein n=1 Tax=Triangularia verruculosa TaxID=2587418 RepID=A0AAN6XKN3_9PEZI|nr:hypothetical protein QBC40DRAFT_45685 [Triangularia verruculosa]